MTTFIKTKFNILDDLRYYDKYYRISKFMEKRHLFYVKNVCKNVKNQQV